MTKEIKYFCNFCNNSHFDKAEIFGTLWLDMRLKIVRKEESDRHLCNSCFQAISQAYNDTYNNHTPEGRKSLGFLSGSAYYSGQPTKESEQIKL